MFCIHCRSRLPFLLIACFVLPAKGLRSAEDKFDFQKLADGVYASIRTEPVGLGVDANNLFIIDDDGVVVVDTNFGPSSTRRVLAALRGITDKPVKYVINTHPHDDHVLGNSVYREAFPKAEFIGHAFLKEYLPGKGATNRQNQVKNLPGFAGALHDTLARNTNLAGQPITDEERAGYSSDLRMIESYLKDAPTFIDVLPTTTVTDRLTLTLRSRKVEILHLGRGHTAGDLVVHLPQEGIVATGDLVVYPIPLVGGDQSFVAEWGATLEKIIALGPKIIVPGHGPLMRNTSYPRLMADLFASVTAQVKAVADAGQPLEEVRKSVNLDEFRQKFAGDSQLKRFLFANYVTGPAVMSAFRAARQAQRAH
jgi:glyoxylase-like metal-dependent hydrolase (beta-lactamase superfamily II)